MGHRIIMALLVFSLVISAQNIEINLLQPDGDFSFPGALAYKEINIIGEIKAESEIDKVEIALLAPGEVSKVQECQVYFGAERKTAIAQTKAVIKPPYSVLKIKVKLKTGKERNFTYSVRNSYSNSQYKSDFKELAKLKPHKDALRCLKFTRDNHYLVSGGDDKVIKILSMPNMKVLRTLKGHRHYVRHVEITPDNKYLISCSNDKTIIIWNFETGQQVRKIYAHKESIHAMALSPDGKTIASAGNLLKLWDVETGKMLHSFKGHRGKIETVVFSDNGKFLISGDTDHTILIWDLVKNELKYERWDAHTGHVISLAIHPSMRYMYSGGSKGVIKWWRVILNHDDSVWDGESNPLWDMRLTFVKNRKKDPADIPTATLNGNPTEYSEVRRFPVYELTKTPTSLYSSQIKSKSKKPFNSFDLWGGIVVLKMSGNGEFLLLATARGEMRIYETFTAYKRKTILVNRPIMSGDFSYDGSMVAIGDLHGYLRLYGIPKE